MDHRIPHDIEDFHYGTQCISNRHSWSLRSLRTRYRQSAVHQIFRVSRTLTQDINRRASGMTLQEYQTWRGIRHEI